MTQMSASIAAMFAAPALQALVEDGDQRQHGEADDRAEDARLEDDAQIGGLAALEQRADAVADAGIDERAGDDADEGRRDEDAERHAEHGGGEVDQPEREDRHEPQDEEIAEGVLLEPGLELAQPRAGAGAQRVAEGAARGEEEPGAAERRAEHRPEGAAERAEEEPGGD